jgi:hypothetical protein
VSVGQQTPPAVLWQRWSEGLGPPTRELPVITAKIQTLPRPAVSSWIKDRPRWYRDLIWILKTALLKTAILLGIFLLAGLITLAMPKPTYEDCTARAMSPGSTQWWFQCS